MKIRVLLLGVGVVAAAAIGGFFAYRAWFTGHGGGPGPNHADGGPRNPIDDGPTATTYHPAPINLAAAVEALYRGKRARQVGVGKAAIDPRRAAVIRGQVRMADGVPAAGVEVFVLRHPDLGRTRTGGDGAYELAVN